MKTWQAISFFCLIWALIYLIHLGSPELRGEEARRIIPAQEMLVSGDWIVPRIAGEPYSNKPPLINWIIAASFHLAGTHSEFTARLPSALSLLALGFVAFFAFRRKLGTERATFIPSILFTSIAMIDKCRIAEIEAIYIALLGIACFLWIHLWIHERSPWLTWTLPYLFLGLGWLAKGPTHLLFWGLFLGFVFRFSRRKRELFHPAHAVGIGLMVAVFLPWMIGNIDAVGRPGESIGTWIDQLKMRANYTDIDFGQWLAHPLEILINFLPWTVPLFFTLRKLQRKDQHWNHESRWDAVVRGSLWCTLTGSILICLLPGGLPRYVLPLFPLAAVALVDLFFRTSEEDRNQYEVFARRILAVLLPLFFIITFTAVGLCRSRGLTIFWPSTSLGILLLVFAAFLIWKTKTRRSFFITSAFAFAAAAVAITSSILPLQLQGSTMRKAATEIRMHALDSNRTLTIYVDQQFRDKYTRELRLLFYLRPDVITVGENSDLPQASLLVVGLPGFEKTLPQKSEFRVTARDSISIDGRPLSLLSLDPRN